MKWWWWGQSWAGASRGLSPPKNQLISDFSSEKTRGPPHVLVAQVGVVERRYDEGKKSQRVLRLRPLFYLPALHPQLVVYKHGQSCVYLRRAQNPRKWRRKGKCEFACLGSLATWSKQEESPRSRGRPGSRWLRKTTKSLFGNSNDLRYCDGRFWILSKTLETSSMYFGGSWRMITHNRNFCGGLRCL